MLYLHPIHQKQSSEFHLPPLKPVSLRFSLPAFLHPPQVIPVYEKGSRFQPTTVEMIDGETSPPQLLTEADLISLMEKHGIGQYRVWGRRGTPGSERGRFRCMLAPFRLVWAIWSASKAMYAIKIRTE